jgi:hypothetical protein
MAVQYSPLPEFQAPNINLLGAYAQGQALQQNALQQQRLQQQMQLAELQAGYTANKDLREAAKLQAEQQSKEFELASKKYDLLVGMSPRLTPENYKPWYKEVVTAFPPAASVLKPEYDAEQVKLIPLQAADMKPQLLQQTIGGQTRLMRAGPVGPAEVVPGSEMNAPPKYIEMKDAAGLTVGYRPELGVGGVMSPEEFQAGGGYMDYMQGREGIGKNPRSTAQGPGQFIDSTFIQTFRKTFPEKARSMSPEQILAQRGTLVDGMPVEQPMMQALTSANQQRLKDAGFATSKGNTYLAHFAGPDGAIDVLSASPDTPITEILSPKAIKSNPEVFSKVKTAGDLIKWAGGEALAPTKMEPIGTAARAAQDASLKIISDLGFDESGEDHVSKLINASTSGSIQAGLSEIPRAFGRSTPGREAIAELETLASEYSLEKLGGKLGGQISDKDVQFIAKTMGDIANPNVPIKERLAAWGAVKRRLARYANVKLPEQAKSRGVAGETSKPARSITRRGTYNGRPVVEYDDGTVEYAN